VVLFNFLISSFNEVLLHVSIVVIDKLMLPRPPADQSQRSPGFPPTHRESSRGKWRFTAQPPVPPSPPLPFRIPLSPVAAGL